MFKELVPILRNRAVLMTATALDDDQIRVNVVPKKMKDGDHDALTTPLSVTGTAEELDTQLGSTLVGFVASHLQMKNSLEKAKADMDAATKTAQAEARAKSKTATRSVLAKTEVLQNAPAANLVLPDFMALALGKPKSAYRSHLASVRKAIGLSKLDPEVPCHTSLRQPSPSSQTRPSVSCRAWVAL
jgi:PRTRC genetic system protein E